MSICFDDAGIMLQYFDTKLLLNKAANMDYLVRSLDDSYNVPFHIQKLHFVGPNHVYYQSDMFQVG
jgi:hypothetical protein